MSMDSQETKKIKFLNVHNQKIAAIMYLFCSILYEIRRLIKTCRELRMSLQFLGTYVRKFNFVSFYKLYLSLTYTRNWYLSLGECVRIALNRFFYKASLF